MTNEENKFERYVDSLRFDDEPSKDHRDKLEKQILEAYDHREQCGGYVEPVSVYLRKLSLAAGFLIVCGILFWGVDKAFITKEPGFIANHPEKDILREIIREERAVGVEKKNLVAAMSDIWDMITSEDADALVSVVQGDDTVDAVRTWAAKHLGRFGTEETLTLLEETILRLGVTDPNDPLRVAASEIRKRLDLPEPETQTPEQPGVHDAPAMRSWDNCSPGLD